MSRTFRSIAASSESLPLVHHSGPKNGQKCRFFAFDGSWCRSGAESEDVSIEWLVVLIEDSNFAIEHIFVTSRLCGENQTVKRPIQLYGKLDFQHGCNPVFCVALGPSTIVFGCVGLMSFVLE